jgi:hypothetical protein
MLWPAHEPHTSRTEANRQVKAKLSSTTTLPLDLEDARFVSKTIQRKAAEMSRD